MDYLGKKNILTQRYRRKSFDLIEKVVSKIEFKDQKAIFVGISGGPACGITKISKFFHKRITKSEIIKELSFFKIDNHNRNISKENEYLVKDYDNYNKKRRLYLIDICSPDSFDYDKFFEILNTLKKGEKIRIPFFDEEKCEYVPEKDKIVDPIKTPLIIVEGYYIFKDKRVREMLNLKIYKDVEDDVRLSRLILREEKYLNLDQQAYRMFLDIYEKFYKISFKENINPYKTSANILLPDYKMVNENNEIEEDETLEFLIKNLTYLSKGKKPKV